MVDPPGYGTGPMFAEVPVNLLLHAEYQALDSSRLSPEPYRLAGSTRHTYRCRRDFTCSARASNDATPNRPMRWQTFS